MPKFLVVKAVVFFTWWQGVLLAVLQYEGLITDTDDYSALQVETALQDFIVCCEMVLAAVAHHYFFTYKDFYDASAPLIIQPMFRSMFEAVNISDVFVDDVQRIRRKQKHREKKKEERRRSSVAISGTLAEGLLSEAKEDHHEHDHHDDDDDGDDEQHGEGLHGGDHHDQVSAHDGWRSRVVRGRRRCRWRGRRRERRGSRRTARWCDSGEVEASSAICSHLTRRLCPFTLLLLLLYPLDALHQLCHMLVSRLHAFEPVVQLEEVVGVGARGADAAHDLQGDALQRRVTEVVRIRGGRQVRQRSHRGGGGGGGA